MAAGDFNAGVDVKYGITSNMTLDATINPDFGQVEVDPAVVNLSAFETSFPEKRPFFLEGIDAFSFPLQVFYSRRIGAAPIAPTNARVMYLMVEADTMPNPVKDKTKKAQDAKKKLDEAKRILTANGSRLVILTTPCFSPSSRGSRSGP